jgi:hypothetical protein
MLENYEILGKVTIQLDATMKFIHLNMFRASICPSSGAQSSELPHMMCSTDIAGCGRIQLGTQLAAELYPTTARNTSAAHHMR